MGYSSAGKVGRIEEGREKALNWRVLLTVVLTTSVVAAEPMDRWDLARDPKLEQDERILDAAIDRIEEISQTRSSMVREQGAMEARSLLERLGGATSKQDRVRYYYGHTLSILNDDSGVISTLGPLVGRAFLDPIGVSVMFDLAVAYAKAEQFKKEIEVYDQLLEESDRAGLRLTVLSNRGESRAKVGDFAGAVADFEKVIALRPEEPLSRWGLAVVLDRWGDLSRAVREGGFAWDLDRGSRSRLDDSGVFFVPAQDRWWYYAIRHLSASYRVNSPEQRLSHLMLADRFYERYIAQSPSTDPWVPLAQARRKMLEARIDQARKVRR